MHHASRDELSFQTKPPQLQDESARRGESGGKRPTFSGAMGTVITRTRIRCVIEQCEDAAKAELATMFRVLSRAKGFINYDGPSETLSKKRSQKEVSSTAIEKGGWQNAGLHSKVILVSPLPVTRVAAVHHFTRQSVCCRPLSPLFPSPPFPSTPFMSRSTASRVKALSMGLRRTK